METIIQAITSGIIDLINGVLDTMGKGLTLSFVVALASWSGVEHLTPPTLNRRENTLCALLFGLVLTVLVHFGISRYANVGAAVIYGLLGGLWALPFHTLIAKRFMKPFLASKE